MSTAAGLGAPAPARRRISPRLAGALLLLVVVAAMALDTTYRKPGEASSGRRAPFDTAAYGERTFPPVQAAVAEAATPLPALLRAIGRDADAAGEQFGQRQGTSPWNFATTGEGVAGRARGGLMPVRVQGVPRGTTVSIQVGPAINGTALRDVTGRIQFGQFVNQVEYAGAATALNTEVKERVLSEVDPASLAGERVRFTGAFTLLVPTAVTIVPTELEPAA